MIERFYGDTEARSPDHDDRQPPLPEWQSLYRKLRRFHTPQYEDTFCLKMAQDPDASEFLRNWLSYYANQAAIDREYPASVIAVVRGQVVASGLYLYALQVDQLFIRPFHTSTPGWSERVHKSYTAAIKQAAGSVVALPD